MAEKAHDFVAKAGSLPLFVMLLLPQLAGVAHAQSPDPDFPDPMPMSEDAGIDNPTDETGPSMPQNASLPGADGLSQAVEGGPGRYNISYVEGMSPDFSGLVMEVVHPEGDSTFSGYSVIAVEEGSWALVQADPPPGENDTLRIYAAATYHPPAEGSADNGTWDAPPDPADASASDNQTSQASSMEALWPLKDGNSWSFSGESAGDSFILSIAECGQGCFILRQSSGGISAELHLFPTDGALYEAQSGDSPRMPLFSVEPLRWENDYLAIDVRQANAAEVLVEGNPECLSIVRSVEALDSGGAISFEACFAPGVGPLRIIRPDGRVYSMVEYDLH